MPRDVEDYGLTPPYKVGATGKGTLVICDRDMTPFLRLSDNQSLEFAQAVARALTQEWETRLHQRLINAVEKKLVITTTDPSKG